MGLKAKRSKKRSGKPISSKPRKDAVLFVDRSLGRKAIPQALRDAGFPVVVHDEKFAPMTPDEEWLEAAGAARWIVLSADKAIRRKANEIEALQRHKVRAVFLTSGNLKGVEQAALFASNGRKIQDHAMSAKPPALFALTKTGELKRLTMGRGVRRAP